ncbi:hypothetical protein [Burkholderia cepacia]|uniref:hypothetical protein n=1 Tax=Burkholderia cepacia TaxID=292 RepID=UPI003EE11C30
MTIRIDTLNNARATLAASGPWGRLAMRDATGLSAEAAHNVRATQNTPVWAGVRASVQG